MRKFVKYIIAAFLLGLLAAYIGSIVGWAGTMALGDPNLNFIFGIIYYTDFLIVFCAGVIFAKIDQLRDDLRKK